MHLRTHHQIPGGPYRQLPTTQPGFLRQAGGGSAMPAMVGLQRFPVAANFTVSWVFYHPKDGIWTMSENGGFPPRGRRGDFDFGNDEFLQVRTCWILGVLSPYFFSCLWPGVLSQDSKWHLSGLETTGPKVLDEEFKFSRQEGSRMEKLWFLLRCNHKIYIPEMTRMCLKSY